MERAKWLDGLRGVAAAIVAFDHLIVGDVVHPFHSYWAYPPAKNQYWLQLPPFRILFSVNAMATLFFVLSGYAIALNLLRARNNNQRRHHQRQPSTTEEQGFFARLSTAAARRVLRLFLPVLIVAVVSHFLYFVNLYHWPFDAAVTTERGIAPWTAPWRHICYLFSYLADVINPLSSLEENLDTRGLNAQLWAIPATLRGSGLVYLLIVATAAWRARPRLVVLAVLSVFFLAIGMWDAFAFIAGLSLAEIKVVEEAGGFDVDNEKSPSLLPSSSPSSSPSLPSSHTTPNILSQKIVQPLRVINLFFFVAGFYLLCLPDDHFIPDGYRFLIPFQPPSWSATGESGFVAQYSWKSIGAVLTVFSISNSPALQYILSSSGVLQHLGKISFSLYLVHQSVYQLLRDPIKRHIWKTLADFQYPGGYLAERLPFAWAVTWIGTVLLLAPIVLYIADEFARYVETKCVTATKELERWLSRK
jgi:peptidoglycan/LPS O-acetylase OafA/YrhL